MKRVKKISESVGLCALLAVAGGFMDAYSYMCRGQVFANAQTGNLLLLGVHLSKAEWAQALRYFVPVLSFVIGIAISDILRLKRKSVSLIHWRQATLLCEAAVITAVCFIPLTQNLLANCLTSLACGIQVETFRKIRGNGFATTMCIGNLRSGTQNLCEYWHSRDKEQLRTGLLYFVIILFFISGAVIGNFFVCQFERWALMGCAFFLVLAFFVMFLDKPAKPAVPR